MPGQQSTDDWPIVSSALEFKAQWRKLRRIQWGFLARIGAQFLRQELVEQTGEAKAKPARAGRTSLEREFAAALVSQQQANRAAGSVSLHMLCGAPGCHCDSANKGERMPGHVIRGSLIALAPVCSRLRQVRRSQKEPEMIRGSRLTRPSSSVRLAGWLPRWLNARWSDEGGGREALQSWLKRSELAELEPAPSGLS